MLEYGRQKIHSSIHPHYLTNYLFIGQLKQEVRFLSWPILVLFFLICTHTLTPFDVLAFLSLLRAFCHTLLTLAQVPLHRKALFVRRKQENMWTSTPGLCNDQDILYMSLLVV